MSIERSVVTSTVILADGKERGPKPSLASRFCRDEQGNIAIIFALSTLTVFSLVGGAVDYGRWLSARNQTQTAIDSALLAAGRTAQTSSGQASASVAAASTYYNQMKSKIVVNDTISFIATNAVTSFEARGTAYVNTPFLSIMGIERLPVLPTAAGFKQAESTIAQGGNSGSSVEVAMMLDTTGSMAGSKMTDMKLAAKDLVDIVIWNDQSQYTSKIGLAPFSEVVNVGDLFQAMTNQNPIPASHYVYPPTCYNTNGTLKNTCKNKSQYLVIDNIAKAKCVTERTGVAKLTDEAPGPNTWITTFNDARAWAFSHRLDLLGGGSTNMAQNGGDFDALSDTTTTTCPERTPLVPLTSDKQALKTAIDGFVAENSTAGALGTAWAWYLLSPEWQNIWPANSRPESYSKLTELGDTGQPKLRKIAVLMTDGAYNTVQGVQYNDNSTPSTGIRQDALDLCNGMKAKGIEVYTIGFKIGKTGNAANLMGACANDADHYYNAENGDELRTAFRDIALKISTLRISH